MSSGRTSQGWARVVIVAALFTLCLIAAHVWKSNSSSRRVANGRPDGSRPAFRPDSDYEEMTGDSTAEHDSSVDAAAGRSRPMQHVDSSANTSAKRSDDPFDLSRYASVPVVARTSPPVAAAYDMASLGPASMERHEETPHSTTNNAASEDTGPSLVGPSDASGNPSASLDNGTASTNESARPSHRAGDIRIARRTNDENSPAWLSNDSQLAPPRSEAESLSSARSPWPEPASLLADLERLNADEATKVWADEVRHALARLHQSPSLWCEESNEAIVRLEELEQKGSELANTVSSQAMRVDVQRATYSLSRRVAVWQVVSRAASPDVAAIPVSLDDPPETIGERIAAVDRLLEGIPDRDAWRAYLWLDELENSMNDGTDTAFRRDLAGTILLSMNSTSLNRAQAKFLAQAEFDDLADSLRRWATEPVDYRRLLRQLEEYERTDNGAAARQVARDISRLRWSDSPTADLAEQLDVHYRNANIRVAVSNELINRWLPQPNEIQEPVQGRILGARVFGRSHATSDLSVRLLPDPHQWRIGLEAQGDIRSSTQSQKGPATFFNAGESQYAVRKLILVDRYGIRVSRAEAQANSDSQLLDMTTDYDSIPLINLIARSIAMQEYEDSAPRARRQMNDMIAGKAGERMDHEVHLRLQDAEKRFQDQFLIPFSQLDLNPTALAMETTDSRVIARYRIAGTGHLGAHTPRPQAPANSALSLQVHQSAMNNTFDQLELGGKRADLHELFLHVMAKFHRTGVEPPADLPADITLRFADREPIHVEFVDGTVRLTIHLAELESPDRHWKNFTVHATYHPRREGMTADLVREEYVQITGPDLGFRDRLPLRAVFSTVLAKERPIRLLSDEVGQRPEFHDMHVSQFTVGDGWVGLAIGPQSPPVRTAQPAMPSREPVRQGRR